MGRRPVAIGSRAGVVLVGASAVLGMMILASGVTSTSRYTATPPLSEQATTAPWSLPGSSPAPTMSGDMGGMAGMDHGAGGMPAGSAPTETPGKSHRHSFSHSHVAPAAAVDRPLAPVLGTFGGGSAAVMLSAVFLRRRDRARSQAKQCARAARRGQK